MALIEISANCSIRIDNKDIKHDISSVQLDQYVDNHHTLEVRLRQVGKASRASDFDDPATYTGFLGKSIAIGIRPTGGLVDTAKELEFIGLVTEVRLENSINGINTVVVTAKSPTIAMDGARKNVFYHDQSASDIIGSLLNKHPITLGNIESTRGTLKFTVQYRETDYEFIMRLAGNAGKFALYDGKEFRLVKASGADIEDVIWRETLGAFAFGLGTAACEFNAQVYNYEQNKDYAQDTKSLSAQSALSALSKVSPDASPKIFADSGFSVFPKSVSDAQTLDEILLTDKNSALGSMIRCFGQSIIPKVAVGHCIKVTGMDKIDGTFWVKAIRHIFDESGKYHNEFECTPLDIAYPIKRPAPVPITELQSAVVVDNNDADKMGRIKVKLPWNQGDETPWVRFMTPHAGKDRGWYCLPEIGDEVLVGFEQGDPDLPVALGALINKDTTPPSSANDPNNDIKLFTTKGGNEISLKDTSGGEELKISMKDGKNMIVMDLSGTGKISIKSDGDISIEGQNISIKSKMNLDLEAGGNMKMKATGNSDVEGAMVNVKGNLVKIN